MACAIVFLPTSEIRVKCGSMNDGSLAKDKVIDNFKGPQERCLIIVVDNCQTGSTNLNCHTLFLGQGNPRHHAIQTIFASKTATTKLNRTTKYKEEGMPHH